jgi:hypothetical protein
MKPLAMMYERLAKVCVYRYSHEKPRRRHFRAMPFRRLTNIISNSSLIKLEIVRLPVTGMITVAHHKDDSDCKSLMTITSTHRVGLWFT